MSIDFNAPQFMLPTSPRANDIPEFGLPNGRGTSIASTQNTSLNTAQMIGVFHGNSYYSGSINASDPQDYYRVEVSGSHTLTALLSGLSANANIELLDASGKVLQTSSPSESAIALTTPVQSGTYYVRVQSPNFSSTAYHLTLSDGNTYYVAINGSDSNAGSFAAPFQTVQRAESVAKAGDTIFLRGGIHYEREIRIDASGTAEAPITFAATPGETAVIDHGLRVPSWRSQGNGIYQGTPIFSDPQRDQPNNTLRVVVDSQPLMRVSDRAQLKEGTFWVEPSTGTLDVWALGGIDPGTKETVILNRPGGDSPAYDALGIWVEKTANYIVLDGLVDRAADNGVWAFTYNGSKDYNQGLVVKNCEIKFAWNNAVRLDEWNGALIENNNIHHNNQSALPRWKFDWPSAVIGIYSHNVTISGNRVDHNYGEGIGPYRQTSHWKILNNLVHDNWSVNIYVDTDLGDMVVDGNSVIHTGQDFSDDRTHPDGIRIGNEVADILRSDPSPDLYNIQITNNRITGTGAGIQSFSYSDVQWNLKDSVIANNHISDLYRDKPAIRIDNGVNLKVEGNTTSGQVSIR